MLRAPQGLITFNSSVKTEIAIGRATVFALIKEFVSKFFFYLVPETRAAAATFPVFWWFASHETGVLTTTAASSIWIPQNASGLWQVVIVILAITKVRRLIFFNQALLQLTILMFIEAGWAFPSHFSQKSSELVTKGKSSVFFFLLFGLHLNYHTGRFMDWL